MTKKLLLAAALLLAGNLAFAGVEAPYCQFTDDDYKETKRTDQNWLSAQMITLSVKANTSVWLTSYVDSWFAPDLREVYNMKPNKYGYIDKEDALSNPEPTVHYSDGSTTQITYTANDGDSRHTQTTKGYYLGSFAEDKEIFLVMRTLEEDGDEEVNSYQYVQDAGHETTLVSRVDGTHDIAGNVRVNFGLTTVPDGREFVAVYKPDTPPSGQPLPGVLIAGLLSMGTVAAAKRLKKRSK